MKKVGAFVSQVSLLTVLATGCVAGPDETSEDVDGDESNELIVFVDQKDPSQLSPDEVIICKYHGNRNDACYSIPRISVPSLPKDIRDHSRRVYVGENVFGFGCSGKNFGGFCQELLPGFYESGVTPGFDSNIASFSVEDLLGTLPQE